MLSYFSEQDVKLHKTLLFGVQKAMQMSSVPIHCHEFVELVFVASGTALHMHTGHNGQSSQGTLLQGDLFAVQKGEIHGYEHCNNMVLYNLFIDPELLKRYDELYDMPGYLALFGKRKEVSENAVHLSVAERAIVTQIMERLLEEYSLKKPGYETMCNGLFMELLVTSLRFGTPRRIVLRNQHNSGVLETIRMMELEPSKHFTLKQLAVAARMSVASYTKKFREETGVSPMTYLLKIRIQQVLYFLKYTKLSMDEIAIRSGFCTANYMIKLFRREIGMTPAKYKQKEK